MRRTRNDPQAAQGVGFPYAITLTVAGTLAASSSNILAAFEFNPTTDSGMGFLDPNRRNHVTRLGYATVSLGSTGSSSATTTWVLKKNGTQIATGSIAYNAANSWATVPILDAAGNGVTCSAGDYLTLLVTAVPGTASNNLVMNIMCVGFGSTR